VTAWRAAGIFQRVNANISADGLAGPMGRLAARSAVGICGSAVVGSGAQRSYYYLFGLLGSLADLYMARNTIWMLGVSFGPSRNRWLGPYGQNNHLSVQRPYTYARYPRPSEWTDIDQDITTPALSKVYPWINCRGLWCAALLCISLVFLLAWPCLLHAWHEEVNIVTSVPGYVCRTHG
jgi:hypothetical protein